MGGRSNKPTRQKVFKRASRLQQVFEHRNTLLRTMNKRRSFDSELMEPWDLKLIQLGEVIFSKERNLWMSLSQLFYVFMKV